MTDAANTAGQRDCKSPVIVAVVCDRSKSSFTKKEPFVNFSTAKAALRALDVEQNDIDGLRRLGVNFGILSHEFCDRGPAGWWY